MEKEPGPDDNATGPSSSAWERSFMTFTEAGKVELAYCPAAGKRESGDWIACLYQALCPREAGAAVSNPEGSTEAGPRGFCALWQMQGLLLPTWVRTQGRTHRAGVGSSTLLPCRECVKDGEPTALRKCFYCTEMKKQPRDRDACTRVPFKRRSSDEVVTSAQPSSTWPRR